MATHQTKFRGYKLFFENQQATDSMIRAAEDFPSFFSIENEFPLIIDCGANIGVSVLEWKYRWPTAKIICFEPDPFAFKLLEANINKNDLPGVTAIRAAISDQAGHSPLYGELHPGADGRGNSLRPEWGQRQGTLKTDVPCVKLANYLKDQQVDFLKIDIEGMEEAVLKDASPNLGNVQAAYIEVHGNNLLTKDNACSRIETILIEAGFSIESEPRFQRHALPEYLRGWQQRTNATQSQIICWR